MLNKATKASFPPTHSSFHGTIMDLVFIQLKSTMTTLQLHLYQIQLNSAKFANLEAQTSCQSHRAIIFLCKLSIHTPHDERNFNFKLHLIIIIESHSVMLSGWGCCLTTWERLRVNYVDFVIVWGAWGDAFLIFKELLISLDFSALKLWVFDPRNDPTMSFIFMDEIYSIKWLTESKLYNFYYYCLSLSLLTLSLTTHQRPKRKMLCIERRKSFRRQNFLDFGLMASTLLSFPASSRSLLFHWININADFYGL